MTNSISQRLLRSSNAIFNGTPGCVLVSFSQIHVLFETV
jgi:hypothetical protein